MTLCRYSETTHRFAEMARCSSAKPQCSVRPYEVVSSATDLRLFLVLSIDVATNSRGLCRLLVMVSGLASVEHGGYGVCTAPQSQPLHSCHPSSFSGCRQPTRTRAWKTFPVFVNVSLLRMSSALTQAWYSAEEKNR